MDVFNNISAQIRDVFASMTAGARITAALLLAVVVVSLGYLFQQGTASGDAYLFGGEYLPASQLDRIEMAIAKRNLSGHIREGNRIRVPAGQKHEYLAAIAEDGATPRNFHDLLENSLNQGGMW